MKKYKHKVTGKVFIETNFVNPDSPTESYYKLDSEDRQYYIEKEFIEGSNDWEEVKPKKLIFGVSVMKEEPNYLITAFRFKDNSTIWDLKSDGSYGATPIISKYTLKEMLKGSISVETGSVEIYSVKNSKGEEFTIGDKVTDKVECFIIESFDLNEAYMDGCFARGKGDGRMTGCSIKLLEKVKSPIYTTTDDVEMLNGYVRKIYLLNKDLSKPSINEVVVNWNLTDKETADRYLTFTSEENRDKYIKENRKPIFVSADNVEIFDYDYNLFSIYPRDTWTEKRCIVKQAIEFENWLHFHTKEARQEYIDNNKPKFSFVDIENAYYKAMNSEFNGLGDIIKELKKLGK